VSSAAQSLLLLVLPPPHLPRHRLPRPPARRHLLRLQGTPNTCPAHYCPAPCSCCPCVLPFSGSPSSLASFSLSPRAPAVPPPPPSLFAGSSPPCWRCSKMGGPFFYSLTASPPPLRCCFPAGSFCAYPDHFWGVDRHGRVHCALRPDAGILPAFLLDQPIPGEGRGKAGLRRGRSTSTQQPSAALLLYCIVLYCSVLFCSCCYVL